MYGFVEVKKRGDFVSEKERLAAISLAESIEQDGNVFVDANSNVYVKDGVGAYMGDVSRSQITVNPDTYEITFDPKTNFPIYARKGYDLVVSTPLSTNNTDKYFGVYCRNYKDMINKYANVENIVTQNTGFIRCNSGKTIELEDRGHKVVDMTEGQLQNSNAIMFDNGLVPYSEHDCFIFPGLGAYMGDAKKYKRFNLENDGYFGYYIKKGYKLVVAESKEDEMIGVFCSNYEEILNGELDDVPSFILKY